MPPERFYAGDEVEVGSDEDGLKGAWFEGRVVRPASKTHRRYVVVYDSLVDDADESKPLQETVDAAAMRLRPPTRSDAALRRFVVGEHVEAYHNDAWWPGVILAVRKGGRYAVEFPASREEFEYGAEALRPKMEWVEGQWVLSQSQSLLEMEISKGTKVEVCSDDEGFRGAWFTATIIESVGKKLIIEYHHLKTDDETELLRETVDSLHIRPTPPETTVIKKFKLLEEVDVFDNDGWWVGVISKVLDGPRYMVYFRGWQQEMEFGHEQLRLHHEWIGGRWQRFSQVLWAEGRVGFSPG